MYRIIKDKSEMEIIRFKWNDLEAYSSLPTQSFNWVYAAVSSFCREDSLHIIVIEDQTSITAIAPLVLVSSNNTTRLEMIGSSQLYEPVNFLYRTQSDLQELCRVILNTGKVLIFNRLGYGDESAEYLNKLAKNKGKLITKITSPTPYIKTSSSWELFLSTLSSKKRYDLQRGYKRLERTGTIDTEFITPGPSELAPLLDEAFKLESAGWKGRNNTSILTNKKMYEFLTKYCESACAQKILNIAFLRHNNKRIAMQIAILFHNKYWLIKIGHDEAYNKYSPGITLINEAIKYSLNNNNEAFEFLGTNEKWLSLWSPKQHRLLTMIFYPYSLIGLYSFLKDAIHYIISKFTRPIKKSPI